MKLTNEICISFLRGSGWLYNHDKEITISERNKAIDDLLEDANEMAIEVDVDTYTMKAIGIGLLENIAEQLKAGGVNGKERS